MPIRVSNLRLALDEPESALPDYLGRVLGVDRSALQRWRILRKSLDARDKSALQFVYTAEVSLPEEEARVVERASRQLGHEARIELHEQRPFAMPPPGSQPLPHRPVVVGSGPAGLVAGYLLALHGYRPLVLERGRAVRERIHDVHAFDAGGEMSRVAAELADPAPDPHHYLGQLLGPDEQQGHHCHDQQFRGVDAEHRRDLSESYERV